MMKENKYSIGLTFFRVITCLLIIKNMCFYLPMSSDLFGNDGIFPYNSYIEIMKLYNLEIFTYPFNINFAPQLFLYTIIIVATLYMFGVFGRITGLFLFVFIMILKLRNGFILDGSDNVMQVTLPFLILADNLDYFRFSDKKEIKTTFFSQLFNTISKIAVIGFLIQISFVYFFTALAKLQGDLWLNGTATFYTMRVEDFNATDWNIPLTRNFYFVVLSTYFTIFWELAFPFLIWFKKTKFWIIFFGILLHIGIFIFMRIDNFSWIMIASYFVFITNDEYKKIKYYFLERKLVVFIDGWCPNCLKFGKLITKVDLLNNIRIENIRENVNMNFEKLDKPLALKKMASTKDGIIFNYGFESIYNIFKYIPILYPLLPIMFVLKYSYIGNLIYNELAVKRKIIPITCDDKCEI